MVSNSLLNSSLQRAVLEVHLPSLKRNCQLLKSFSQNGFFCPMVKDNAYGHGVIPVVQALQETGVKCVGVLSATEAWQIWEFIQAPLNILIFGPILNKEDWQWIVNQKETCLPVINNWPDLEKAKDLKKPIKIHLKFDTGFTRLGFLPEEGEKIKSFLQTAPFLQIEGLCTQLMQGENETIAIKQLKALQSLFSVKNTHCLNTEALISLFIHQGKTEEGARPGIGLYGIKPPVPWQNEQAKVKWKNIPLKRVSTLKSYIVNIHQLKRGGKVSYSGTWTASRDSVIATVSLGYGDGFFRSFSNRGKVLYRGQEVPLVGRVCMDFFMIDLTDISSESPPYIGEEVVIFGHQKKNVLSVSEQADSINTIPYEIFVNLGDRVKRIYTGEKS